MIGKKTYEELLKNNSEIIVGCVVFALRRSEDGHDMTIYQLA